MRNLQKAIVRSLLLLVLFAICGISAHAVPNRPTLLQPADKDSCVSKEYMFVWQQEVLINGYDLQIFSDAGLTTPVFNNEINTTYATVNLPNYYTKYWWRVIVHFENGVIDTSDVQTFKTKQSEPTELQPLDMQGCLQTDIHFSWVRPDTSLRYRLQIADSSSFNTNIIRLDTVIRYRDYFDWKAPENNKNYYWRMCTVMRESCSSDWTATRKFATAYKAPVCDVPLDGQSGVEPALTLYWNYNLEHESFGLQVSENSDMSEPFINVQNLATPAFTLSGLDLNKTYYWRVNAVVVGCTSDWTPVSSFTTKFPVTTLISPNMDAECISKATEFLWHAIPTARAYTLQISTVADFDDIVTSITGINDTTAIANVPSGLTTYYWRVRGEDSRNIGDWSDQYHYNTTFNEVPLISPANNAPEACDLTTTLKWTCEYPEEEYIVQVSTSQNFSNDGRVSTDTVRANTIDVNLPESNTIYYWRVGVLNALNCNGMWSEVYSFHTKLQSPILTYPENGADKISTTVNLEWESVPAAEKYDVQVATDAEFATANIVASYYKLSGTIASIMGLNYETEYFWRARANGNGGTSNWSEVFSFTTTGKSASTPELIYPAVGEVKVPLDVEFQWSAAEGAETYEIIVASDVRLTNVVARESDIEGTTYTLNGLKQYTTYYWTVAGVNQIGQSDFAPVRSFRTTATMPKAPTLVSPANGAENHEMFVEFTWGSVETCDQYYLQVATSEDFADESLILDEPNLVKPVHSFISSQYGVTYFWRVLANNEVGRSDWSEIRHFTIKPDPSGVNDISSDLRANVSPNPARENFALNIWASTESVAEITVLDASGVSVASKMPMLSAGDNRIEFDVQGLASGVYFVNINTKFGIITRKITVVK